MPSTVKPKSILKKPAYPATKGASKEARNREVALYHAEIIQQRKDVEYQILLSTEELIEFPLATAPIYDASNPSLSDAAAFKDHIRLFQPNDYDEMIVERNINEHCGYALCANPRRKKFRGGKYSLVGMNGKAKDFKVIETGELEKWCSDACARRALYVRVQLSARPAWERGDLQDNVELQDEPNAEEGVLKGIEDLNLDAEGQDKDQKSSALALERGDRVHGAKHGLVEVSIKENDLQRPAQPPTLQDADLSGQLGNMHLNLEGHTPSFVMVKDGTEGTEA